MNGHIYPSVSGARRRAAVLLLTIGALLFVGMQSRVAQDLPSRSSQQLLTSLSDPVKFPLPEDRVMDSAAPAADPVALLPPAPPRPLEVVPVSVPYVGARFAAVHLLRAPPASL